MRLHEEKSERMTRGSGKFAGFIGELDAFAADLRPFSSPTTPSTVWAPRYTRYTAPFQPVCHSQ